MSHAPITVYSSANCGYCVAAKNLLNQLGLTYDEVRVDLDPAARQQMMERARRTSVPQIFIGAHHVGGFDDLAKLNRSGELQPLLDANSNG